MVSKLMYATDRVRKHYCNLDKLIHEANVKLQVSKAVIVFQGLSDNCHKTSVVVLVNN